MITLKKKQIIDAAIELQRAFNGLQAADLILRDLLGPASDDEIDLVCMISPPEIWNAKWILASPVNHGMPITQAKKSKKKGGSN